MYELRNPVQHGQTVVSVVPEPREPVCALT